MIRPRYVNRDRGVNDNRVPRFVTRGTADAEFPASDPNNGSGGFPRGTQVSRTALSVIAMVSLIFTASSTSWADPAQDFPGPESSREAEPGTRNGPAMRMGTLAGYALFAGERILGIGGYVAGGMRLGRVFIEAEYGHIALYDRDHRSRDQERMAVGTFDRLGITGRVDIFELGRDVVGANSKLVFWLEGGLGRQRGRWTTGDRFERTDRVAGVGLLLDHRFKRPLGFPSRVGWHFGWRFTNTRDPEPEYLARMVCKTIVCPAQPADRDISLLVSSGMHFSW